MFRHVVMFRYAEGTTAEQRAAVLAGLVDGNFDLAVVAEFDDAAGYRAYAVNADHQALIAERIKPVVAQRSAVQFDAG
jgi:hypothetical protein